jgi:hypothetical protein
MECIGGFGIWESRLAGQSCLASVVLALLDGFARSVLFLLEQATQRERLTFQRVLFLLA